MTANKTGEDQTLNDLYDEVSTMFALHGITDEAGLLHPVVSGDESLEKNADRLKAKLKSDAS